MEYYQVKYKELNGHYHLQSTTIPKITIRGLLEYGLKPLKVYRVIEGKTVYSKQTKTDVTSEYLKG